MFLKSLGFTTTGLIVKAYFVLKVEAAFKIFLLVEMTSKSISLSNTSVPLA